MNARVLGRRAFLTGGGLVVAAAAAGLAVDFAANTLYGRQHLLDEIPVRLDCGTGDGFLANDRAYAAGLTPVPSGGFSPGGHNYDYWRRMASGQLAFLGQHLTPV